MIHNKRRKQKLIGIFVLFIFYRIIHVNFINKKLNIKNKKKNKKKKKKVFETI